MMLRTVSGLREAVNELPPNVRKILKYIARDSIDPYEPVSVVCDFIGSLDKYLSKHIDDDRVRLARAVRWRTIVNSDKTSGEIFDQDMFERIGEKMRGKRECPSFNNMNDFIEELTDAGVLYRYQAPHSEALYVLTPEAAEALRVLHTIRGFPWSYPINILPKGPLITKKEECSKAFPEYKKRFLELEMDIIEGRKLDLPENVQGL
jgi:hypothetical protein